MAGGGGSGRDGRGAAAAAADVVYVVVVAVAVAVGVTDATQVSGSKEPKQLPPRSRTRRCGSPERSAPLLLNKG